MGIFDDSSRKTTVEVPPRTVLRLFDPTLRVLLHAYICASLRGVAVVFELAGQAASKGACMDRFDERTWVGGC